MKAAIYSPTAGQNLLYLYFDPVSMAALDNAQNVCLSLAEGFLNITPVEGHHPRARPIRITGGDSTPLMTLSVHAAEIEALRLPERPCSKSDIPSSIKNKRVMIKAVDLRGRLLGAPPPDTRPQKANGHATPTKPKRGGPRKPMGAGFQRPPLSDPGKDGRKRTLPLGEDKAAADLMRVVAFLKTVVDPETGYYKTGSDQEVAQRFMCPTIMVWAMRVAYWPEPFLRRQEVYEQKRAKAAAQARAGKVRRLRPDRSSDSKDQEIAKLQAQIKALTEGLDGLKKALGEA